MNNVIVLLIDSVFSECLGKGKTEISSTPFVDTLINKGLFAPNVYSYGPYTDAATKGLYCGIPTLSNYGYYYGINSSDYNHFRLFHENGYETYGFYYPYYLISSKVEKYIDHSVYTGGFKFISVWSGKLEYYAQLKRKRKLTQQEYSILEKCLEMVFDCWLNFYENIDENDDSHLIVREMYNKDLEGGGKAGLLKEVNQFNKNKNEYINNLLELGMSHPLAQINEFDYGREEDLNFIRDIYKKNSSFFKKLAKVNLALNLKNNPISFYRSLQKIKTFLKTHDKSELRYFSNYGMLLLASQMMIKRSKKPQWQDIASLNKQIETMFIALTHKEDSDKPFYVSLHALEPHHNISFFSFDCFDESLIKEELDYISPLLDKCGKDFSGNLSYQLSLCYVDLCVKRLFDGLKERNLLENTTVMLVADHGSSYIFDPVRTRVVNNFHKENYNIPMLIWQNNMPIDTQNRNENYFSSADVFPTLCDVVGITLPEFFCGLSVIKNPKGRNYVITEYMGPGVPDMITRDVWISIRNKNYVIAYKNQISKPLDIFHPFLIYDLRNDPNEIDDNQREINIETNLEVLELLVLLNNRYMEIQEETARIMRNFDDFNVI